MRLQKITSNFRKLEGEALDEILLDRLTVGEYNSLVFAEHVREDYIILLFEDGRKALLFRWLYELPPYFFEIFPELPSEEEYNIRICKFLWTVIQLIGCTYESLAQQLEVSPATVCNYLSGARKMPYYKLYELVYILDLPWEVVMEPFTVVPGSSYLFDDQDMAYWAKERPKTNRFIK